MRSTLWIPALLLLCAGCVNDAPADPDEKADQGPNSGADGDVDGADVPPSEPEDEGVDEDPPDEGVPPDGGDPDRHIAVEVESCDQACARFEGCGRADELFGNQASCLEACRSTEARLDLEGWFSCVGAEACGLLHLCRLPQAPRLGCAAICEEVEACGVELPTPCAELCAEETEAFTACGEHLVAGCEAGQFWDCLGESVFSACAEQCAAAVQCNIVAADACVPDCLAQQFSEDPLAARRAVQRSQCVRLAGEDCLGVDACYHPGAGPAPIEVNEASFCREWRRCGGDQEFPCEFAWEEFGQDPEMAECIIRELQGQCPQRGVFEVFDICFEGGGGGPRGPGCNELCEAQALCGQVENQFQCSQECFAESEGQDPDAAERRRLQFPCGVAEDCPALEACLDAATPAAACADHCAALDGCGLAAADCAEACDTLFARDRQTAWRACVAEAANCDAMTQCAPAGLPPCAEMCAAAEACDRRRAVGCEARCDDAHYVDPLAAMQQIACVLTAPACAGARRGHHVNGCLDEGSQGGLDCFNWCRPALQCVEEGQEADMHACLIECGAGYAGDEGLRFAAARECLAAEGARAGCPALAACVPEDLEPDCAGWCEALIGCGLEDEACEARCAEDALSRLRAFEQAACVGAAADCGEVGECVGEDLEPIGPVDPGAFCGRYDACNFDDEFGFPCEEFLRFFEEEGGRGEEGATLRCAYDLLGQGCPGDPFVLLDQCFEGGGVAPELALCANLCEAQGLCAQVEDVAACTQACVNEAQADAEAAARLAPRLACAGARGCEALEACIESSSPEAACATHCERLVECGAANDEAGCVRECDEDFVRVRQQTWAACVGGAAECEAVLACDPGEGLPCAAYCARLGECGLDRNAEACAGTCDDNHFRDPLTAAARVSCVLAAEECRGVGEGATVDECQRAQPDDIPGSECVIYCRGVTECQEGAERTLEACVTECVGGFRGADALLFAQAAECLSGLRRDVQCRPLLACIPEEVEVDCEAHCGAIEGCQLPAEGCAEACAEGPDLDEAGCVADAERGGRGCGRVAECVGFEVPPVGAACDALCDEREACEAELDGFLCRLECSPEGPEVPVRAACAQASNCGEQAACLMLDAEPAEGCVEACEAGEECGGVEDVARCAAECTGFDAAVRTPPDYIADVAACIGEAEPRCEAAQVQACLEVSAATCRRACELLDRCFDFGDVNECTQNCEQQSAIDPNNQLTVECLVDRLQEVCDERVFEDCVEREFEGP